MFIFMTPLPRYVAAITQLRVAEAVNEEPRVREPIWLCAVQRRQLSGGEPIVSLKLGKNRTPRG